jgi:hypothetical protein
MQAVFVLKSACANEVMFVTRRIGRSCKASAVAATYSAKADYDHARKEKRDTTFCAVAMGSARASERSAIRALDKHRKEHNC